jgi:hypothetical protein
VAEARESVAGKILSRTIDLSSTLTVTCLLSEIYAKALSTNLIQAEVEQIVPLTLARAGYEKRQIEAGKAGWVFSFPQDGSFA